MSDRDLLCGRECAHMAAGTHVRVDARPRGHTHARTPRTHRRPVPTHRCTSTKIAPHIHLITPRPPSLTCCATTTVVLLAPAATASPAVALPTLRFPLVFFPPPALLPRAGFGSSGHRRMDGSMRSSAASTLRSESTCRCMVVLEGHPSISGRPKMEHTSDGSCTQ